MIAGVLPLASPLVIDARTPFIRSLMVELCSKELSILEDPLMADFKVLICSEIVQYLTCEKTPMTEDLKFNQHKCPK